jgi:hypothetical protein
MANRFPGGGNMPHQLLDMLNNGEDIGALWEGILAEIALHGGFGGDANEEADQEGGDVEDDVQVQMPGSIEDPGSYPEEEEEEDEDEEQGNDVDEEAQVRCLYKAFTGGLCPFF